jgi:uncharacterized protein YjbI with pentapeptide repeats
VTAPRRAAKQARAPIGVQRVPDLAAPLHERVPALLVAGFTIADAAIGPPADLAGADAAGGRIARSTLHAVSMTASRLRSVTLTDVRVDGGDASNADWAGARLKRVVFETCRMTGFGGAEVEADDVHFRDCKLDLANFRFARMQRTTFQDCVLHEADFSGAALGSTRFDGCDLRRADFEGARLSRVDLRGSDLEELRGDVLALRGAIVDSVQLVGLAPLLAERAGILVEDGAGADRGQRTV